MEFLRVVGICLRLRFVYVLRADHLLTSLSARETTWEQLIRS